MPRRRNPATSPHLAKNYDRVRTAVEEGLRAIVDRGDGSSKIWQPVRPEIVGPAPAELDLLRYALGAWPRTGIAYEPAAPRFVDFMAFAYAAERASLAQGETAAAKVFAFLRQVPANARKVADGYAAPGGLSRILMASREMTPIEGEGLDPKIHCSPEMLSTLVSGTDALVFARSEMWPVGQRWLDGWAAVDKAMRKLGPRDFAWRGKGLTKEQIESGLLMAGTKRSVFFGDPTTDPLTNVILRGRDMNHAKFKVVNSTLRNCTILDSEILAQNSKIFECDMNDSTVHLIQNSSVTGGSMTGAKGHFYDSDLSRANLRNVDLTDTNFSNTKVPQDPLVNFTGSFFTGGSKLPPGYSVPYSGGRLRRG